MPPSQYVRATPCWVVTLGAVTMMGQYCLVIGEHWQKTPHFSDFVWLCWLFFNGALQDLSENIVVLIRLSGPSELCSIDRYCTKMFKLLI